MAEVKEKRCGNRTCVLFNITVEVEATECVVCHSKLRTKNPLSSLADDILDDIFSTNRRW